MSDNLRKRITEVINDCSNGEYIYTETLLKEIAHLIVCAHYDEELLEQATEILKERTR